MKRTALLLLAVIAVGASGCYSTTLKNGKPIGDAPLEGDQRWHHGFVGGTSEASGPYQLSRICPEGWAEIQTETSFSNGLLDVVTLGLYNPQTVDVKCVAGPAPRETASSALDPSQELSAPLRGALRQRRPEPPAPDQSDHAVSVPAVRP